MEVGDRKGESEVIGIERGEYRHGKCGGVVVDGEVRFDDEEDCPICEEVRANYRDYGIIRATVGTPLAQELGLKVSVGKVGGLSEVRS